MTLKVLLRKCKEHRDREFTTVYLNFTTKSAIPDLGVSTAILNPVDIFCRWYKLNFGPLRDHVKLRHITAVLLIE